MCDTDASKIPFAQESFSIAKHQHQKYRTASKNLFMEISSVKLILEAKKLSKIDIPENFFISPSLKIVPVLALFLILRNLHVAKAEKFSNKIIQSY